MPTLAVDRIGQKFNRLTILAITGRRGEAAIALCQCDCGNQKQILVPSVVNGNSKSCGCFAVERGRALAGKYARKHGHSPSSGPSSIYKRWRAMLFRCSNPNATQFNHYGGRGITVCERWKHFPSFLEDVGEPPSSGMSLDRIDNNGNYEPGNVRWATKREQGRNTRTSVLSLPLIQRIQSLRASGIGPGEIVRRTGLKLRTVERVIYEKDRVKSYA